MTIIYQRDVAGPATHAFLVGAGAYPDAKPGRGVKSYLRTVPDLPSAADSAKFMCKWLHANEDRLGRPLASIEILLSDPPSTVTRYPWAADAMIDSATSANVLTAGGAWWDRLGPGDTALFYCCGHGARHHSKAVLMLEDLNSDHTKPWSHLNIEELALSLKQHPDIGSAFLFADVCGEINARLELSNTPGVRFYTEIDAFERTQDKVLLVCASPSRELAYEGLFANPRYPVPAGVKIGRFTQVLVKALDGASARWIRNRWTVETGNLHLDLKPLWRFYFPEWSGKDFEPSPAVTPNDRFSITHPDDPIIPVLVVTDPDTKMLECALHISQSKDTRDSLYQRAIVEKSPWPLEMPAMTGSGLYALAATPDSLCHSSWFVPDEPNFDLQVAIS